MNVRRVHRLFLPIALLAACDGQTQLPPGILGSRPNQEPEDSDRARDFDNMGVGHEELVIFPLLDGCDDILTDEAMGRIGALDHDPLLDFEAMRHGRRSMEMANLVIDCEHRAWLHLNHPTLGRRLAGLPVSFGQDLDAAGGVRDYQGETYVSMNPNNTQQMVAMSNTFFQDANCVSPTGGTANTFGTMSLFRSNDGGGTWTYACAPWPAGVTGGVRGANAWFGSDPTTGWDSLGNAYAVYMLISQNFAGQSGAAIVMSRWVAGGTAWQPVSTIVNNIRSTTLFDDKEMMAVDITTGQTHSHLNRIYVVWDENNVERVAHSDPPYTTWTTVPVDTVTACVPSGSGCDIGGDLTIGADGTVYAMWNRLDFDSTGSTQIGESTVFSQSTDGGTTWSQPVLVARHALLSFGSNHHPSAQDQRGVNAFPSIGIDTRNGSPSFGRIYAVYSDYPSGVTTGDDLNVYLVSSNNGTTWSSPTLVNDVTTGTQFFPWLSVDQSDSSVNVAWYDTRNAGTNNRRAQIFYSRSADGGMTFAANTNVTDSGNNFVNHVTYDDENSTDNPNYNANQYGDYAGIAAGNHQAHVVWTDSRNFYPNSGDNRIEDLATVTINNPDFNVTCAPTALTIAAGHTGMTTCTVQSYATFQSAVTLSCANAPAGVTCAFATNPVTPPSNGTITSNLTLTVAANAVLGAYVVQVNGVSGAVTHSLNLNLTIGSQCGDAITQSPNETCDNGTNAVGSGCNACQIEPTTTDLAGTMSDRRLLGAMGAGQLGNVAIGDINGDGFGDVLVAEEAPYWSSPRLGPIGFSGAIHGYLGSASFFNGTSQTIPTGQAFEIRGPNASAYLGGGYSGSLAVGDVTGDGIPDIIAGAPGYNGLNGARPNSGAIYCLNGQASLGTAGTIDLSALNLPSFVRFTIVGAASGDYIRVMGLGDLNGDGIADIIVGAPGSHSNGLSGAGAVYVVNGLGTGTVDLSVESDPHILAIVRGASAGDQLGATAAAIGDVTGDNIADLAVASPISAGGAGMAWVIFGPVPATRDLSMNQFSASFTGEFAWDGLGESLAIGQVRGDQTRDLVIGVRDGWNDTPNTLVGYIDVWTGPITMGAHQLTSTTNAGTRIYGRSTHSLIGNAFMLGDVNHDGYLDIIAGTPGAGGPSGTRTSAGEVTIVIGAAAMAQTIDLSTVASPSMRVYGPVASGEMAAHPDNVASGDINGDGHPDWAVGTPFAGGSGSPGQVDIFRSRW